MDIGICVGLREDKKNLEKYVKANCKYFKLSLPFDAKKKEIDDIFKFFNKYEIQVYVVLNTIVQTPIQSDPLHPYMTEKIGVFQRRVAQLCSWIPKKYVLGICSIENIHLAARTHMGSLYGIDRKNIVSLINDCHDKVRKAGFKAVFSIIGDEICHGTWDLVSCDIYDIHSMLSRNTKFQMSKIESDRPIWLGSAGTYGGFLLKSQQLSFIKRLKEHGEGLAEFAFIYSRPNVERHSWFQGKDLIIDFNKI